MGGGGPNASGSPQGLILTGGRFKFRQVSKVIDLSDHKVFSHDFVIGP